MPIRDAASPSIVGARDMAGKTIARVEFGEYPNEFDDVHESELLNIYFADGTAVSITTGSNFKNLCDKTGGTLRPNDLNTDLQVMWHPAK